MSLFGDGQYTVDLRNFGEMSLQELGINKNPYRKEEVFFLTDSGMGYGDIIRSLFYAKRISDITGFSCRVVFIILKVTTKKHIANDGSDKLGDVVFRAEEEIEKIRKVHSFYDKGLGNNVRYSIFPIENDTELMNYLPSVIPYMLPTRTLATTSWLGFPYLKPNNEPEDGKHIAVWTTKDNLTSVSSWKDPIGSAGMIGYTETLRKEYGEDIRYVSYRDDIEYVWETIRTAKLCIGYEGMGNLISQSYKKPIIVFSKNEYHSKVTSGMWSEVTSEVEPRHYCIEGIIQEQRIKISGGFPNKTVPINDKVFDLLKGTENEII